MNRLLCRDVPANNTTTSACKDHVLLCPLSLSLLVAPVVLTREFQAVSVVCRNLCERLYSKIIFGKSHYEGGKKYCRRCEVYFFHDGSFCPCCGMALRTS